MKNDDAVHTDEKSAIALAPTRRGAMLSGASAAVLAALPRGAADAREPNGVSTPRLEMSFDEDWRFYRGDVTGAEATSFNDVGWRALDLPHDWRIEDLPTATSDDGGATSNPSLLAFHTLPSPDGAAPSSIGPFDVNADPTPDIDVEYPGVGHILMAGGRSQAYTVAGVGWYRKHFRLPPNAHAQVSARIELRFDGIYRNADVWLNGVHLGFHPNGYTSFAYDLSPHLNATGDNVIAVRVDNRGKTSRWYSGSGIYRHTWLTITAALRIPLWGVQVTTPVADQHRSIAHVEVQVENAGASAHANVRVILLDPSGRVVSTRTTSPIAIAGGATSTLSVDIDIASAALWSPEQPSLYSVHTEIIAHGTIVDAVTTPFGIRSLVFNGTVGFQLNGRPYKVRGANIHHDHGPLGSVAIDRAEERTIEVLKSAGFNAIRAAHNPPSPAMLDACDRLGVLVLEEFSDVWDIAKLPDDYHRHFPEWWERDLGAMVRRDRNHPSVIAWSVGNEIGADPNGYGPRLAALVRSLDKSRPVAQGGMNVGAGGANAWSYVDIADYHGAPPAADRAAHADKAFLQSEDTSPQIYDDWKLAQENAWYVGTWVWSGWDYLGESGSGAPILARTPAEAGAAALGPALGKIPYPWFNNCQGDIDLIGQRKPQNYWRAVVEGSSKLEIMVERPTPAGLQQFNVGYSYFDELASWTWDVAHGHPMKVRVYTGGDTVTLLLNGQTVAAKHLTDDDKRVAVFVAPYTPGELVVVASRNGQELARKSISTRGAPASIRLTPDVQTLTTGRGDLAHILVEILDAEGEVVPDAVVRVGFAVDGAGELAGTANGNPHNVDSFQRPRHWTWHGQALIVVRPKKLAGTVSVSATAPGLRSCSVVLPVIERH